jgi:hypothetical protein
MTSMTLLLCAAPRRKKNSKAAMERSYELRNSINMFAEHFFYMQATSGGICAETLKRAEAKAEPFGGRGNWQMADLA